MQIRKFCHISGTCSFILAILIAVPAFGHGPDDPRCDALTKFQKNICKARECPRTSDLEEKLLKGGLSEMEWECWEKNETNAGDRKASIADGKYNHYQGGWRHIPAFFARSMNLAGKIEQTNGSNTGYSNDGVPVSFDTSKNVREVSFGWSKKKILEDFIVMIDGPETLKKWKDADGSDAPAPEWWSVGNLP